MKFAVVGNIPPGLLYSWFQIPREYVGSRSNYNNSFFHLLFSRPFLEYPDNNGKDFVGSGLVHYVVSIKIQHLIYFGISSSLNFV
jgi:hypothetical protein